MFLNVCCSGGSKSRLAKAAGAEPSGHLRGEELHTVVARITFRGQNATSASLSVWKFRCRKCARHCGGKQVRFLPVKKIAGSEHFWELRCWKSARRCGAKMREAHLQVKSVKNWPSRATWGR